MERSEKSYQPEVSQTAVPERCAALHLVERLNAAALEGESFEDAVVALQSVETLQNFRKRVSPLPFGSFHEIVEEVTNLNKLPLSKEERSGQTAALVEVLEQKAVRLSPRVADLYLGILAEIKGGPYEPKFVKKPDTRAKLAELRKKDETGWSDLDVLFSPDAPWDLKVNRILTRLDDGQTGYLSGVRALDRRERREMDDDIRKWREEELKKALTHPPDETNRSKPGVDPMERLKEGERATAIWKIQSAYDGYCNYYKEKTFSRWDNTTKEWVEDYRYADVQTVPLSGNTDPKKGIIDLVKSATVECGRLKRLAVPYTHGFHKIEAGGRNCRVQQDQNGDLVFLVEGTGEVEIKVFLAPDPNKKFTSKTGDIRIPNIPSEFTEETNNKLEEIKDKKRGNVARARAIVAYARSRIKYLAPKDRAEADRYNAIYRTSEKGFAGAVDEIKNGDCDTVNTYFAALCAKLNIPVRHTVGHSVNEDETGNLIINSGTGHGWSEVWDEIKKEWVLLDATPAGDPNLEEQESKKEKKHNPGAFGGQEAVRPSDEELEALRKKLAEHKEKLSYTKEERQLAEAAGVELKEARQIVKEINEAERTRLPDGEPVVDALAKLFNAIVESRKSVAPVYDGPVRRREGGERIEDIVRHKIGMMAGETDPLSREKLEEETKEEKIIGGFDLYMVGDKSGSMQSTTEEGERLWEMQRRAIYLIFSSLHRFERNTERAGLQKENSLSVRTQSISFRGANPNDIDLDKPLSPQFTAQDKVKLWRSLTEQGSGNGDVEALSIVYEQIKKEVEETEKRGGKDNRLRLVIACSDGGYVGAEGQMQALAEALHKLNVVVVGMGLTETAASVPVVMHNPPASRGDIARDINDLPVLVAKHVVLEAVKLFPKKVQESAKQIIESSIAKFRSFK